MRKYPIIITVLMILFLSKNFAIEKASDFKLENIKGKKVSLSDFQKEGLVILDFWATWCEPCKKALPKLNNIHEKYDSVVVVTICTDKPRTKNKAKTYIKSNKYKFYSLFDLNKKVQKMFNVVNIPRTIMIAPDGIIIYDHTGYQRGDEEHYEEVIQKWINRNKENKELPAITEENPLPENTNN